MHPESGTILVLHQHLSNTGEEFDERRTGLDHVSLRVAEYDELLAWQERLKDLGVPYTPIADRTRASAAKAPTSHAISRGRARVSCITASRLIS